MFLTLPFLVGWLIFFFFAQKTMVTIPNVLGTLNIFFLVLTAVSSFFTEDCSRQPYGKKEMSVFLVESFDHMNPDFSANL